MENIVVPRLVVEAGSPDRPEKNEPRQLSYFNDRPAIVVLGDPGAGKSTLFKTAAAQEPNAEFVTVRRFLTARCMDP